MRGMKMKRKEIKNKLERKDKEELIEILLDMILMSKLDKKDKELEALFDSEKRALMMRMIGE